MNNEDKMILSAAVGGGVNGTIVVREWKSEWECVGYVECAW